MPPLNLCDPTPDELAEYFAPESILMIVRRRGFDIRLNADGTCIEASDEIPVWLANAITIYGDDLIALMRDQFLGDWREF